MLSILSVQGSANVNHNEMAGGHLQRCSTSLLLLSHVQLSATPQMAAHQAPPSLGFSRQERWSGLPFPSPVHESEK